MATQLLSDPEPSTLYIPRDAQSEKVESFIRTHPMVAQLQQNPAFIGSRPHLRIPENLRAQNLTAGPLMGGNKIVVPPYVFHEEGGKSLVSIFSLGSEVAGHPGIVHGGLIATLLDESLARCCFPALQRKIAVTASLGIDYRSPAPTDNYYVLNARTVKVLGRKAWVEGQIEIFPQKDTGAVVVAEARALFVEPTQATEHLP